MSDLTRQTEESSSLFARVLAGEPLDVIGRDAGLTPRQLIEAIGEAGLIGEAPDRPALVQERPAYPSLREALSESQLSRLFPKAGRPALLSLSAGLLLIHDFWDDSHTAAQTADDLGERHTSAYWHGIAHRREPDPGNASYWFRRVGRHEVFAKLVTFAKSRLSEARGGDGGERLIKGGSWDPFAMIELCDRAKSGSASEALALDLQREEMRLLLAATLDRVES